MQNAQKSFDPLEQLIADRVLGPAAKLAFITLWKFAGGRPGHVTITAAWLASRCGRDRKTAFFWLEQLQNADLIRLGERDSRRGSIEVFIFHPSPGHRAATPDSQTMLPLAHAGEGADSDPFPGDSSDDGPTPAPASPADGDRRGSLRSETPAPPTARGSFASETPARRTGGPQGLASGGEACAGVSDPKLPRAQCNHRSKEYSLPQYHSSALNTAHNERGSFGSETPAPSGPQPMAVGLIELARKSIGTLSEVVGHREQKDRLKKQIQAVCGFCLSDWCAGCAANLVVYHEVPLEEIEKILCDLDAMRRVGTLKNPSGFFHSQVRKVAGRYGKPWPRSKIPTEKIP